jgi:hypothetical protein
VLKKYLFMRKNLLSILALGLGLQSFAQIVYTDITDVTLTPTTGRETLDIDLNNDGTNDFTIFALDTTIVEQGNNIPAVGCGIDIHGNNEVDASSQSVATGNIMAVTAYSNGLAINSSGAFMSGSGGGFLFPGGVLGMSATIPLVGQTNGGNFINTTDQYIAVKFEIGVSMPTTHYGWIRIDMADNAANMTVKDFAYETTAGAAINAGATGGVSINEKELANAEVFYGNSELNVNGIYGTYNVTVVDLLGKSIVNTTATNNAIITLDNVNNGIYLVKITKGNAVVTKKVYIK